MALSLLDRIRDALLTVAPDPTEFEQRALMLLEDLYPTLVPIAGGTDFGRDGDASDNDGVVRVMATTAEDVARNLRTGLRRLAEEGLDCDRVVVVTSQPETARLKQQLVEVAEQHGSRLVELHGRQWLASALHDHPEHRRALLGITGDPPALVQGEVVVARLGLVEGELIARDEELGAIEDAAGTDVLLVGRAGAGKTRLAAELEGALFVNTDASIERIGDDLRSAQPPIVVVDDAVRALDVLRGLVALREEGAAFRIIATAWPDHAEEVTDVLPLTAVEVRLLDREEGAELLRTMGIANDTLIGLILDQAEGRAGWMALLGSLALRGSVDDVIDGVALSDAVRRFARRAASGLPISRDAALDVLGSVALGGRLPDDAVRTLGEAHGLSRSDTLTTLGCFTDHGLLDYFQGAYTPAVRPVRAAIVANLLGPPPRLDVAEVLAWPWTEPHDVLATLLFAAHRGSVRATTDVLRIAPGVLQDMRSHREPGLLDAMVQLSPRAAAAVIDAIDEHLDIVSTGDLAAHTVKQRWASALAAAVRGQRDQRALDLLVQLSITSEGGHNDMVRRPLLRLAQRSGHHDAGPFEQRLALVGAVARNVDRLANAGDLAGDMIVAACSPEGRFETTDPIEGMSLTLTNYIEGSDQLRRITDEVWPEAVAVTADLPADAVRKILDGLSAWARCAAGGGQLEPSSASIDAARRHLHTALSDLRPICAESPSLSVMWNQRAARDDADHDRLSIPPGYRAILPTHQRARLDGQLSDFDYATDRSQQTQEVKAAAADLRERGIRTALEQVAAWLLDHGDVELRASAARLLRELPPAGEASDVLSVAITVDGLAGALQGLMTRCLEEEPGNWSAWWPELYEDPMWRDELLRVAIDDSHDAADLRRHATTLLGADDAWKFRHLFTLDPEPGGVLDLLLSSELPELRDLAVTAFSFHDDDHGPALPEEWKERWEDAFLSSRPPSDPTDGWRWDQLAQRLGETRPDLLARWLRAWLDDVEGTPVYVDEHTKVIGHLPLGHRLELLEERREPIVRQWLVEHALAHDAHAAISAIEAGVVEPREVARIGYDDEPPDAWFEEVAPVLLDQGVEAQRLAAILEPRFAWGEESERMSVLADYADELADRDDERLAEIGRAAGQYFRERAETAAARERDRRIRGR